MIASMKATKLFLGSAAVLAALLFTAIKSPAPIFIKFDGVDGEANAPGITNGVELLSFSVGHTRTNQPGSLPVLKDVVVVKQLDKSSPKLAESCANGQHFPKVEIVCRKAGSTGTNNYYTVTLEDCLISSYSVSGGGGSAGGGESLPTESISFNYTKIEWKYVKQDPTGVPTEPPVIGRWPPGPPVP
jgi:type VI secretion system secreted protein Hcp